MKKLIKMIGLTTLVLANLQAMEETPSSSSSSSAQQSMAEITKNQDWYRFNINDKGQVAAFIQEHKAPKDIKAILDSFFNFNDEFCQTIFKLVLLKNEKPYILQRRMAYIENKQFKGFLSDKDQVKNELTNQGQNINTISKEAWETFKDGGLQFKLDDLNACRTLENIYPSTDKRNASYYFTNSIYQWIESQQRPTLNLNNPIIQKINRTHSKIFSIALNEYQISTGIRVNPTVVNNYWNLQFSQRPEYTVKINFANRQSKYQNLSEVFYNDLINKIIEVKKLKHILPVHTFIYHIPGYPEEFNDSNYIVIEKQNYNLPMQQNQLALKNFFKTPIIGQEAFSELETVIAEAGLGDISANKIFLTNNNKIIFRNVNLSGEVGVPWVTTYSDEKFFLMDTDLQKNEPVGTITHNKGGSILRYRDAITSLSELQNLK